MILGFGDDGGKIYLSPHTCHCQGICFCFFFFFLRESITSIGKLVNLKIVSKTKHYNPDIV